MNILKKTLNRYNGNLCFLAENDFIRYVLECSRFNQTITYDTTLKFPTGVCVKSPTEYLILFGDTQIGLYSNWILNESYKISPITVDQIVNCGNNYFYLWSYLENCILKMEINASVTQIWRYDLPSYFNECEDARLFCRESDGLIVFKGNGRIISLQDEITYAIPLGDLLIGSENNFVSVSNDTDPIITYVRSRQVSGKELEVSSSSSSSSTSESSSSSSIDSSSSSSSLDSSSSSSSLDSSSSSSTSESSSSSSSTSESSSSSSSSTSESSSSSSTSESSSSSSTSESSSSSSSSLDDPAIVQGDGIHTTYGAINGTYPLTGSWNSKNYYYGPLENVPSSRFYIWYHVAGYWFITYTLGSTSTGWNILSSAQMPAYGPYVALNATTSGNPYVV